MMLSFHFPCHFHKFPNNHLTPTLNQWFHFLPPFKPSVIWRRCSLFIIHHQHPWSQFVIGQPWSEFWPVQHSNHGWPKTNFPFYLQIRPWKLWTISLTINHIQCYFVARNGICRSVCLFCFRCFTTSVMISNIVLLTSYDGLVWTRPSSFWPSPWGEGAPIRWELTNKMALWSGQPCSKACIAPSAAMSQI